jgi:ATP-dependent DNA ligase
MIPRLPFFPPAPAEAGASIVDLAPDDWALETKQNGVRIVFWQGRVYTRQGELLSKPKGADVLTRLLSNLDKRLCVPLPTIEGEWILKDKTLWLFDLPDHLGTYDERHAELVNVVRYIDRPGVKLIPTAANCELSFREFYEAGRDRGAEGVLAKRRDSRYIKSFRPGATAVRCWLKYRYEWALAKGGVR